MKRLALVVAVVCGTAMGQATVSTGASTGSARTGTGPPFAVSPSNRQQIPAPCCLGSPPGRFGPFSSPRAPVTRDARPQRRAAPATTPDTFLYLSYEFYRQVLSPVDGVACLHRPSCSRYALDAVRRYPTLGLLLAVDRLWRSADSSAVRRLPLVREGDYYFFFDPLEESDAWYRRSH